MDIQNVRELARIHQSLTEDLAKLYESRHSSYMSSAAVDAVAKAIKTELEVENPPQMAGNHNPHPF
jgi:hypothetical protein